MKEEAIMFGDGSFVAVKCNPWWTQETQRQKQILTCPAVGTDGHFIDLISNHLHLLICLMSCYH